LAGAALDFESHVGKRCLLVGDAGGFVSAFSNEGLYPALRSGWRAAEVAAAALRAPLLQDELAGFGNVWRSDLAEYLRMPNTDLGLLLPMVFTNAQMSRRIARAFFLGQAF
jgi:flavin-dependent dehydrogenase